MISQIAQSGRRGNRTRVALIVVSALVVAAGIALTIYRDDNLHGEERTIAKAFDAGMVERQVEVDGATINYAEGPDNGPALLLVHGQGMEWEDYASVLPELAKRYHVFAVDCFGHGESSHDRDLYTLETQGTALIGFAREVIGDRYIVSGHSSGGIIVAYVAANDPDHVAACVLEDPPFFSVLPEEVTEGAGAFAYYDGYIPAHEYVTSGEAMPYAAYYAERSYLFSLFGDLQGKLARDTREWCATRPDEHVVNAWIPRAWTRGLHFMDDFDPAFGDSFYTGSFFDGADQAQILAGVECPAIYLKAETDYGDDGVLYAANTDEDAERMRRTVPDCEMRTIKSGHDIHVEHPDFFISAIDDAASQV